MSIIYKCDRCDKVINSLGKNNNFSNSNYGNIILCVDCLESFGKWLMYKK